MNRHPKLYILFHESSHFAYINYSLHTKWLQSVYLKMCTDASIKRVFTSIEASGLISGNDDNAPITTHSFYALNTSSHNLWIVYTNWMLLRGLASTFMTIFFIVPYCIVDFLSLDFCCANCEKRNLNNDKMMSKNAFN